MDSWHRALLFPSECLMTEQIILYGSYLTGSYWEAVVSIALISSLTSYELLSTIGKVTSQMACRYLKPAIILLLIPFTFTVITQIAQVFVSLNVPVE